MKISIHQPSYLPWLGYLEKIKNSDVFIYLDTVQFSKNSFENRNTILLNNKTKFLTIPVKTAGRSLQLLNETEIANPCWGKQHLQIIKQAYSKSPNFSKYYPLLEYSYYLTEKEKILSEICFKMLPFFMDNFNIKTPIIRSSELNLKQHKSDLILEICQRCKATEYYSGRMGKNYLNMASFAKAGINVIYQEYRPSNNFSAIHQLFTEGNQI